MKHNSTKQSLARKVTLKIVFVLSWLVIFPIIVMSGIIDIVAKKNSKVNANTRIVSDQSKIVPKNTNDLLKMPKGIEER
jgi:hypothetical protein